MKSRPILLDMTTCAGADLPSPTHLGANDGGMTTLDYGVCEVIDTDHPDWRHTPVTIRRPTDDDTRSTTAVAVDCYGDPASVGRTRKWSVDEDDDDEDDTGVCWAAYHHHVPGGAEILAAVSCPTSSTSSSFRPSVRTSAKAIPRTHVYEMPLFQS